MSQETQTDAFDSIEYPTDFVFKAMCRLGTADLAQKTEQLITELKGLVEAELDENSVLDVSQRESRTSRFIALSLTVHVENRPQLEAIYSAIASHQEVVMTL